MRVYGCLGRQRPPIPPHPPLHHPGWRQAATVRVRRDAARSTEGGGDGGVAFLPLSLLSGEGEGRQVGGDRRRPTLCGSAAELHQSR